MVGLALLVTLVGSFFLPPSLNEEFYLQLLEETNDPLFPKIIENEDKHSANRTIFQQDGGPPHYTQSIWISLFLVYLSLLHLFLEGKVRSKIHPVKVCGHFDHSIKQHVSISFLFFMHTNYNSHGLLSQLMQ